MMERRQLEHNVVVERNVTDQDQICVNTIRMLAIDIVQRADSGHPGMPMGAATMAHVLWTRHLRHNPKNPQWFDRDRFVLSAGHASALLYSLLFLTRIRRHDGRSAEVPTVEESDGRAAKAASGPSSTPHDCGLVLGAILAGYVFIRARRPV